MGNHLKALAVVAAVVPALALGQGITNSKHDLSSLSSTTGPKASAGGTDQTCIFCHTPHKALAQSLIWNHTATTAAIGFTATTTTAGTSLPTTTIGIGSSSKVCLSCHDGTVGIGSVNNAGAGTTGTIAMTVANMPAAYQVGPSLDTNHPVSIPYAGETGTYNTIVGSKATATTAVGDYWPAVTTAGAPCTTPTGFCVNAANGFGYNVTLYGTAGALGIECGSCHDVHNKFGNSYLLRVTTAQSALCRGCHNK